MAYLYEACDQISDSCHQQLLRKMQRKMCIYKCILNGYKNQQNRQTGSRNLMGPKMLPTIWGTYMKLVTKYQISAINICWEKCDEKWAYSTLKDILWWITFRDRLPVMSDLESTGVCWLHTCCVNIW